MSIACLLGQPRRGWSGFSHLYSHDWCFFNLGTDVFRVIFVSFYLLLRGRELTLPRWIAVIRWDLSVVRAPNPSFFSGTALR